MKIICLSLSLFFLPFSGQSKNITKNGGLCLIENKGQLRDQFSIPRNDIHFKVSTEGSSLFMGTGSLHYQFAEPVNEDKKDETGSIVTYRMDVELLGCNKNARPVPGERQPYYELYYTTGGGEKGLVANSYKSVTYKNIYPGIDWVLYVKGDVVKHEFVVSLGADPSLIRIQYSGASSLTINAEGKLLAATPLGTVAEEAPYCYSTDGTMIGSAFRLDGNIITYNLAAYSGGVTIDPSLVWGTYYHGSFNYPLTSSRDIALHGKKYVYMCGQTGAIDIATTGAHQVSLASTTDAFLVKFDSSGNRLWCTYYGGSSGDDNTTIACDSLGYVYMAGRTQSNNLIATTGSHQSIFGGVYDGFVVKFDSAGTRIWGTYYGGSDYEEIDDITIDMAGNIYFSGASESNSGISTIGSYQNSIGGGSDGFLVKFDGNGNRIWGSYFGGSGVDIGYNIATGYLGSVYLAGSTYSTSNIATTGSHQSAKSGQEDAYLAKFDSAGGLYWATYYGGDSSEFSSGLGLDHSGNVYLNGSTGWINVGGSTNNIATTGSFMPSAGGLEDAFLVKFDSNGNRQWGTYYGGSGFDHPGPNHSLAIDNWDNVYISGSTSTSNLSTTGVWQSAYGGGTSDGYVAKFTSGGAQVWSSYYGGTIDDRVNSPLFDGMANLYVIGNSSSDNAISTPGAFQENNGNAYYNAFFSRINDCIIPLQPTGLNVDTVCANDTVVINVPIVNGALYYTWSLPGGWAGSSTTNTITVIAGNAGGSISVTAHSACGSSPVLTQNITVYPAPFPTIIQVGNQLNTGSFLSYQWYLNGNAIVGATSQFYTFAQQGVYTVSVTDSNGCGATSPQFPVGVGFVHKESGFRIYPNPAHNEVYVESALTTAAYRITDQLGRVVLNGNLKGNRSTISLRSLSEGMYFLYINETREPVKLFKQ